MRITNVSLSTFLGVASLILSLGCIHDDAQGFMGNFAFFNGLRVTGINPASATSGTQLTISGVGFKPTSSFTIGGVACASMTYVSNSQVQCIAPTLSAPGFYDVFVKDAGPAAFTLSKAFYYIFDTDAQNYFSAIASNSGTISSSTKTAINNLIVGLKADGTWTKLIEVYPFAGDQLAAALVKLKVGAGNSTVLSNHNFLSGDYQETGAQGGLKGDGSTKYLDSNLQVMALTRTSISIGAYIHIDSAGNSVNSIMGSSYDATGNADRFYLIGSGNISGQAALGAEYPGNSVDGAGFRLLSYNGASFDTYKTIIKSSVATSGLNWQQVGSVLIFKAAGAYFHNGIISTAFVGTSLSAADASSLYSRIQTFEAALSRNI